MSNETLRNALKAFPRATVVNPVGGFLGDSLILGGSNREHVFDLLQKVAESTASVDLVLTQSKAVGFSVAALPSTRVVVCDRTIDITLEGLESSSLRAGYDTVFFVVNNIYGVGYSNLVDIYAELFPRAKCFVFNVARQFFILDANYQIFLKSFSSRLAECDTSLVEEGRSCEELRLLVDASGVTAIGRTGIENYTLRMLESLAHVPGLKVYALCQDAGIFNGIGIEYIFFDSSFGINEQRDRLEKTIEAFEIDLFISPHRAIPAGLGIKSLLVVHDVIPMIFPDFFETTATRDYFDTSIRAACGFVDLIVADSDSTRNDIERVFGVSRDRIRVIYPGAGAAVTVSPAKPPMLDESSVDLFILYNGTIEPRKGVEQLLAAFRMLRKEFIKLGLPAPSLVLSGKFGWSCDVVRNLIIESRYEGVIHLGYVSDAELAYLYRTATVLVYPSSYEGFGLPVLEAFSFGLPVITFKNSSLSEVGGDAAYFARTQDAQGIYDALYFLLRTPSELERMRREGLERAKQFSWLHYKKDICSVLRELFPNNVLG